MIAAVAAAAFAADPPKKGRIEQRKQNQQERIAKGVESGSLTPKEAAKLEAREANLNRTIRRDRKDGGGLTAKERARIEKRQDKLSRDIAREKHDKQKQ